ncbi:MAG: S-methyl-5-thioribose-1-phosphate isomerase [Syntrophomonas sp.]
MIKTLSFEDNAVVILDQSQLPGKVVFERCLTPFEVAQAIKSLKVRGAPLIGVTAAFGMALAAQNFNGANLVEYLNETARMLVSTRPTAVNLLWAVNRMMGIIETNKTIAKEELIHLLANEAMAMYDEDITVNKAIGDNGQELLGRSSNVMTICNAGALATCGYGTALGVIRSANKNNKIEMVWACETRPVLQGSRLTVWELLEDKIPVTLITDNMAGHTMALKQIDAVITGADRIAANGDAANKIGTYSLAVLARHHNIPFYIAAPLSTFDISVSSGQQIPIEERDEEEVRQIDGNYITVSGVKVFNPAFDVTPYQLVTGIITEKGIIKPPFYENIKTKFQEMG